MKPTRCVVLYACLGLLFLSPYRLFAEEPQAPAEESHPGMGLETAYAEAMLAYNAKNYNQALELLDRLLAKVPNDIQALQLRALSLKTLGNCTAGGGLESMS